MKKVLIKVMVLSILVAVTATVSAQSSNVAGIYKTENDYVNHKLSYSYGGSTTGSIRVNDFFSSPTIVVKVDGKKYSLLKSEIFGYQASNGKSYRFNNGIAYEIVDTAGFYFYTTFAYEQAKSSTRVLKYFFSANATDAPRQLTKEQLDNVFAANTKFRYSVAAQFTNDNALVGYDSFLHCYKLKYLFTESLK